MRQHFDLAAQPRGVGLQQLDLVEELDEALALQLRFERRDAVVELLLDLGQPLVGRLDALARLVVVEQRRARGRRADRSKDERRGNRADAGEAERHSPT